MAAHPGQPGTGIARPGPGLDGRGTAGFAGGILTRLGNRHDAGLPVSADDLAVVLDAPGGDGHGGGGQAHLLPAGLRRRLVNPAQYRGRRAQPGPALAATGPQPERHPLGSAAAGDPARSAGPGADRGAAGHRHPLDRAGALRNARRQRRPRLLHPRYPRPPSLRRADGAGVAHRLAGLRPRLPGAAAAPAVFAAGIA